MTIILHIFILYFSIFNTTGISHLKNGIVFFTYISISSLVGRRVLSLLVSEYRNYRYSIEHTFLPTRLVSEVSVQYRTHASTENSYIPRAYNNANRTWKTKIIPSQIWTNR